MLARIFTELTGAEYVDATELIVLSRRLGSLWPDFTKCERAVKRITAPVTVVPGYIALGPEGETVTLGRGGSDFSAAILARDLGVPIDGSWTLTTAGLADLVDVVGGITVARGTTSGVAAAANQPPMAGAQAAALASALAPGSWMISSNDSS